MEEKDPFSYKACRTLEHAAQRGDGEDLGNIQKLAVDTPEQHAAAALA